MARYQVFTRAFDAEIEAKDLDRILGALEGEHAQAFEAACAAFERALLGWRTRLDIAALEAGARIGAQVGERRLRDTVVTLLADHSGSMRGQKMLLAAAAVDVATGFLSRLGAAVEILGFTTVSWWNGSGSFREWDSAGRPRNPGRLCDLLHIVYRSAEDRSPVAPYVLRNMLRPDLPKENVDGEAVEWAVSRLRSRPEARKILVVLSDGVPADDATLAASDDADYLLRHLESVLADVGTAGDVAVGAVGIGYPVDHIYGAAARVDSPDDLGAALLDLLEHLLVESTRAGARPTRH